MSLLADIQSQQHLFSDQIATLLRSLQQADGGMALPGILALAFAYGVLHAIGPGHGKLIISGYLLAERASLRRGLGLAVVSSLLQACTATVLVLAAFYGLQLAQAQAQLAAAWLEMASFTLVALIGMALVARGARRLPLHRHTHSHDHAHEKDCCGGHHAPLVISPQASLRELAFAAFSVGIRPCSGAIIVLFFACLLGVAWAGVLAVFAMAAGTALATGTLAVLAVKSRELGLRLAARSGRVARWGEALVMIIAGLLIVAAAGLFLLAAASGLEHSGAPSGAASHPLLAPHQSNPTP
jgi:nickel/cobalt exporter